jgi:two-component system cell cycle response regulator DivK
MSQIRVLLVEDNPDNFELVRFLLEQAGHQVLAANTGRKGLEVARQELPDLILMDLSLPEIDGWKAATQLKGDPKTAGIPLLALTAHTLPGDRQRALDAGFNGFISKPIDIRTFPEKINQALQSRNKAKQDE